MQIPNDPAARQELHDYRKICLDYAARNPRAKERAPAQIIAAETYLRWVFQADTREARQLRIDCLGRAVAGDPHGNPEPIIKAAERFETYLKTDHLIEKGQEIPEDV